MASVLEPVPAPLACSFEAETLDGSSVCRRDSRVDGSERDSVSFPDDTPPAAAAPDIRLPPSKARIGVGRVPGCVAALDGGFFMG